jgi:hypothetical protein
MNISSKLAGIGILLIAILILLSVLQQSFPDLVHTVLKRDPPIVGHPKYGRPQTP